jgi:hypothetical protein
VENFGINIGAFSGKQVPEAAKTPVEMTVKTRVKTTTGHQGGGSSMTTENQTPIIIYQDAGKAVEVRLDTGRDTVWLTQRQMAEIFDTSPDNIGLHLKNIFNDNELDESATTEESSVVRQEGRRQVTRQIQHYNLDAIISVGSAGRLAM